MVYHSTKFRRSSPNRFCDLEETSCFCRRTGNGQPKIKPKEMTERLEDIITLYHLLKFQAIPFNHLGNIMSTKKTEKRKNKIRTKITCFSGLKEIGRLT